MQTMYDWRAGHWSGTTDDLDRAKEQAEDHLQAGEVATVEKVVTSCGYSSPLGVGWTATRNGGTVMWARRR